MDLISVKMGRIKPSPSSMANARSKELIAAGVDLCAMASGEPDFDTPPHIVEAAVKAMREGQTRYTAVDGSPALKKAICDKFRRENELAYETDQITVGAGGKQVIFNALTCTVDEGDEVIVPAPYWVSYPDMVRLSGGTPVFIVGEQALDFKITPAQLEAAVTPKTKWLVLNSPSNPSGATYTLAELAALGEVVRRHPHMHVLTDDIYEHLIFDGRQFATFAQANPDLIDRTLTVNGVSKSYAMTGWRLGYAAGSRELITAIRKLQSQSSGNPSSVSQAAAVAALNGPTDFMTGWREAYQRRRDFIVAALNAVPGMTCPTPGGAFYVYPSCGAFVGKVTPAGKAIGNDQDFTMYLLDECRVAAVNGASYGVSPAFRLSFATSDSIIEEACRRIAAGCAAL